MYKVYDIKCLTCKGQNRIGIDHENNRVDWITIEPLISSRLRFDGEWGFQCNCGANELVTPEENKFWLNKSTQPQPQEMKSIMDNLNKRKSNFEMVGV